MFQENRKASYTLICITDQASTAQKPPNQERNFRCLCARQGTGNYAFYTATKQLFSTNIFAVVAKYAEQRNYVPISVRGKKKISHETKFLKVIGSYQQQKSSCENIRDLCTLYNL